MSKNKNETPEILVIDVGNTSVRISHYSGMKFKKAARIKTSEIKKSAARVIKKNFPLKIIKAAVIASVVPAISRFLTQMIRVRFHVPVFQVGKDISAPIPNKYRDPRRVGMDRLMNALAVREEYKLPAIIIDFGTAVTFDVVSGKGEYLGGVIAPGIEISIDALFNKTALLPKIRLTRPREVIGRDTVESIRIGCAYGIGGLCDRIVEVVGSKLRSRPFVIATGGYARFMSRYCHSIQKIDPDLVLKGILFSYQRHCGRKLKST